MSPHRPKKFTEYKFVVTVNKRRWQKLFQFSVSPVFINILHSTCRYLIIPLDGNPLGIDKKCSRRWNFSDRTCDKLFLSFPFPRPPCNRDGGEWRQLGWPEKLEYYERGCQRVRIIIRDEQSVPVRAGIIPSRRNVQRYKIRWNCMWNRWTRNRHFLLSIQWITVTSVHWNKYY